MGEEEKMKEKEKEGIWYMSFALKRALINRYNFSRLRQLPNLFPAKHVNVALFFSVVFNLNALRYNKTSTAVIRNWLCKNLYLQLYC